jgi:NAD(P)-dependent dehydrogenase (short-subunit alcohol dehydrogenase family)
MVDIYVNGMGTGLGKLEGKVAVITGGCSGIGLATVELFIAEGAKVVIADIQDGRGADLVQRFGEQVDYQRCDVTSEADIATLMQHAAGCFGSIDILFNNAGAGGARETIEEMTGDLWDRTQALLLRSVALGIRYAVPFMKQRGGAIVNTASIAALGAGAAPIAYSVAKAGVLHLSLVAAAELARYGIRVNAICPGFMLTEVFTSSLGMSHNEAAQANAALRAISPHAQPLAIPGTPDHIAQACLYLASAASGFVTGTHILVDGGISVGPRHSWDPNTPSAIRQILESAMANPGDVTTQPA